MIWKITVSGPFVTLYSNKEFLHMENLKKYYRIPLSEMAEHIFAHDENIVDAMRPSHLRDTHSHIVLPCRHDLVIELKELLENIEKNNTFNEKLIDSNLIKQCVESYQYYLNTVSLDEHKKNVSYVLLKWVCPYINSRLYEEPMLDQPEQKEVFNFDEIGLEIIKFLNNPSENSFDFFVKKSYDFFQLSEVENYFNHSKTFDDFFEIIPISSTNIFNQFLNQHPFIATTGFVTSAISIIHLIGRFGLYFGFDSALVAPLLAISILVYGPSWAETVYTAISKFINNDINRITEPKLSEIMRKNHQLLTFQDHKKTTEKTEIISEKLTIRG